MDCEKVFEFLVTELENYLKRHNLKAMILGISGGIDSTVVAAICHEVSERSGIPLIGRSLPTHFNKLGETNSADLVGNSFCNNYVTVPIEKLYQDSVDYINEVEDDCQTLLANGNIQARIRMIYLYNLASIHGGLVMDTDNLTEHYLGYFTLHGDQGDYAPMRKLWKTEVFELAEFIKKRYESEAKLHSNPVLIKEAEDKAKALEESLKLKPTAGLGITNSDLDEIGANSYFEVDSILKRITEEGDKCIPTLEETLGKDVVQNVIGRYKSSEFKRKGLPVYPEFDI